MGVLLTGVYGSGTSSGEPCALLDLDYLGGRAQVPVIARTNSA